MFVSPTSHSTGSIMGSVNTTSSGSSFITGTASGVNSKALIESAIDIRLAPKRRIEDQITINDGKTSGFQRLQRETASLKSAFDRLKSDFTNSNAINGKRATATSSNSSVAPSSVLTATVASSAASGTYGIVVNNTAKAFSAQGTNQSGTNAALNADGSFDIAIAGKTPVTVSYTASSTLQDIALSINATTATSGVRADVLQVSPGQFRLIVRGNETAKAVSVTNISGDNVLATLGVTDVGGTFTDVTQPATQADITVNGTQVFSDSNQFSNLLTGVTINVVNSAPGTTINVTVDNDTDGIKSAIQSVVTSYNTLRASIAELQKAGSDGQIDPKALLYGESLATALGQALRRVITGTYGATSNFSNLRSVGVSIDASNNLVVDSSKLDSALKNNFADVKALFASTGSTTGIADTASALLDTYANTGTGSIQNMLNSIRDKNLALLKRADKIEADVESYKITLILKYAKMEAAVKAAQTKQAQIKAIIDGTDGNN